MVILSVQIAYKNHHIAYVKIKIIVADRRIKISKKLNHLKFSKKVVILKTKYKVAAVELLLYEDSTT